MESRTQTDNEYKNSDCATNRVSSVSYRHTTYFYTGLEIRNLHVWFPFESYLLGTLQYMGEIRSHRSRHLYSSHSFVIETS